MCTFMRKKAANYGGLFILGFIIGMFPCAPLLALLFEISLISNGALAGLFYALFFGLGTLISGLIVIGSVTGIFTRLPAKIFSSKRSNLIFRIICALLLMSMGLGLIFGPYPHSGYQSSGFTKRDAAITGKAEEQTAKHYPSKPGSRIFSYYG